MKTRIALPLVAALALAGCSKESTPAPTSGPTVTGPALATNAAAAPAAAAMKTTASGLKYQALKQGTGTVSPKPTEIGRAHV